MVVLIVFGQFYELFSFLVPRHITAKYIHKFFIAHLLQHTV